MAIRVNILLFALTFVCSAALAGPRPKAQLKSRAKALLTTLAPTPTAEPEELAATTAYSVYGYPTGGFVVLTTSEALPEVIGYSDTTFGEGNPAFTWYLSQVEAISAEVESRGETAAASRRAPDTSRFPSSVAALLTSSWGQEAPYWNLCPKDPVYGPCYTGCVATALAQILYYHKYPPHGYGERTITYPLEGNNVKDAVTAKFGETTYDWDNMLDSYSGSYTEEQAEAVATLMMHCGVAARMKYAISGSGAYTAETAYGAREYFGLKTARSVKRADYVDSDWMDMVYTELAGHRPILYGAVDMSNFGGGHAFVLDGYNASGFVHVNWGWDGEDNGYYDINLLNPRTYRFADDQDMIIGIYGKPMELLEATFKSEHAGSLAETFTGDEALRYSSLTIEGDINATDLACLRSMAGRDSQGRTTTGNLRAIDLSGARFLTDGTLPSRAFYACQQLERITLPAGLKHWGEAALALCFKLEDVSVGEPAADADFIVRGDMVLSPDSSRLFAVFPSATAHLQLPLGLKRIDAYALAGCKGLTSLRLPSSLETIGDYAFYYCSGLTELRAYGLSVPTAEANAFSAIDPSKCQLAVRRDMRSRYLQASPWNVFAANAREFYTIIRARNSTREYGDDNPVFGYTLEGDDVEGEPLLLTDAGADAAVGRYAITPSPGTITDEAVEYAAGTLIVRRAPLTLRPADCTVPQGSPLPTFTLLYEGLKLSETDPAFTEQPIISTTATPTSPLGTYPITVTGGDCPNYSLTYAEGTLTITEPSGISTPTTNDPSNSSSTTPILRDLQGRPVPTITKGVFLLGSRKLFIP